MIDLWWRGLWRTQFSSGMTSLGYQYHVSVNPCWFLTVESRTEPGEWSVESCSCWRNQLCWCQIFRSASSISWCHPCLLLIVTDLFWSSALVCQVCFPTSHWEHIFPSCLLSCTPATIQCDKSRTVNHISAVNCYLFVRFATNVSWYWPGIDNICKLFFLVLKYHSFY